MRTLILLSFFISWVFSSRSQAQVAETTQITGVAQVIDQNEIHLALPVWESEIIGYSYRNEPRRVFLMAGVALIRDLANNLIFLKYVAPLVGGKDQPVPGLVGGRNRRAPAVEPQFSFFRRTYNSLPGFWSTAQFLAAYLTSTVFFANAEQAIEKVVNFYYGVDNRHEATRLVSEHAEKVCTSKGFRKLSGMTYHLLRNMELLKPVSISADGFGALNVFLDGVRITSKEAKVFMENSKSNIHHQFNSIYCE